MTATVTTITGPILALDLGKFNSVACALDKNNPAAPRFAVTSPILRRRPGLIQDQLEPK
jgi:hypothetical protein